MGKNINLSSSKVTYQKACHQSCVYKGDFRNEKQILIF